MLIKNLKLFILISCFCSFNSQSDKLSGTPLSSGQYSGLELSSASKISKISWSSGPIFGIFEGANDKSFSDAIPLFMIKDQSTNSATITLNQGFKYVRFVNPGSGSSLSNFDIFGSGSTVIEPEKVTGAYQATNLPLVVIHTDNGVDPKDKTQVSCTILIIKDGKVVAQKKGTVKLRGNSTMNLDKKAYAIKFEEKMDVLGLPAKAKKWVLLANHYDKTLLRNSVAFKMSEIIGMKYTPKCTFVDVMVNGIFRGNYQLCDQIEVRKGRLEISELDGSANSEPAITGGYLLVGDGMANSKPPFFKTAKGASFGIKYPDDITSQQSSYIEKYINKVESEIYSNNVDNIDVESFCKYFIVEETIGNPDCNWASLYLYKEKNDPKIYFGPVWDFDLAFDNDMMLYPTNQKTNFAFKYLHSNGNVKEMVQLLLSNEKLLQSVKDTWQKASMTGFAKEAIVKFIDEEIQLINESQKLNFIKWNILSTKMILEPEARGSYEKETNYLKEYVSKRFELIGSIISKATKETVNEEVQGTGGFGGMGGGWGWPGQGGNNGGNNGGWTWPGQNGNNGGNNGGWTWPGQDGNNGGNNGGWTWPGQNGNNGGQWGNNWPGQNGNNGGQWGNNWPNTY